MNLRVRGNVAAPQGLRLAAETSGLRGQLVPEPLIDTERAAVIIGIHPKTLQKYARRGVIRGIQVGKRWRFRASVIDEWIARKYAD
jgi:excisionase family DNA binding protein